MTPSKEPEVFATAYQLYLKGLFQQAYDLLTRVMEVYPAHQSRLYQWRFSMAARQGNLELAEKVLREALDSGNFYSKYLLRHDEDLKALQGRPGFENLLARDLEMLALAQQSARPQLTIFEPTENRAESLPLLMALHGNHSNVEGFQGYWNKLADKGWLVALPQSSRVGGKGVFDWNDAGIATQELAEHYALLCGKFVLDAQKVLLAGFSMGGYTALQTALRQILPGRGFLAVAPYVGDLKEFEHLLDEIHPGQLRGYFLLGEEDQQCTPGAMRLQDVLNHHGITCGVEVFAGVAHAFPEDYQAAIDRALQFILSD